MPAGSSPLVSRWVLEILAYLATNRLSIVNLLFYMEPYSTLESSYRTTLELKKAKGKEKHLGKMIFSWYLDGSQKGEIPLVVLLKILSQPHLIWRGSQLEQVLLCISLDLACLACDSIVFMYLLDIVLYLIFIQSMAIPNTKLQSSKCVV